MTWLFVAVCIAMAAGIVACGLVVDPWLTKRARARRLAEYEALSLYIREAFRPMALAMARFGEAVETTRPAFQRLGEALSESVRDLAGERCHLDPRRRSCADVTRIHGVLCCRDETSSH